VLFISQYFLVVYVVQNSLIDDIHLFNHSKKYSKPVMDDHQGFIEKISNRHNWSPWQLTC